MQEQAHEQEIDQRGRLLPPVRISTILRCFEYRRAIFLS